MSGDTPAIRYLSLGWGVQSFTIAAMCALGELEGLDVAVHADTTHEGEATYDFARRWTPWLGERGVRVEIVSASNNGVIEIWNSSGAKAVHIPAFTTAKRDGSLGQVKRQCTVKWKIKPLRRYVRSLLPYGRPRPGAIECWMGISLDEWHRMRNSDVRYIVNAYPLVDKRMTRADCVAWLEANGLEVPPKSACVFCPFHSLNHWRNMKRQGGVDWRKAVEVDSAIRTARDWHTLYVHPARVPLAEAVSIPEDCGARQLELDMPCDGGVCFV